MRKLNIVVFLLLLLFILACSSDDSNNNDNDSQITLTLEDIQNQIEDFVSPEVLQALEDLGFVFREGLDTPDITGSFLFDPQALAETNISEDFDPGTIFISTNFNFFSQNNDERIFNAEIVSPSGNNVFGEIIATFFTGNGNSFNAYFQVEELLGEESFMFIIAISGILTPEGITNAQNGVILLSSTDTDNPNTPFLPGEGRVFTDVDDLAERQTGNTTEANNSVFMEKYKDLNLPFINPIKK